MMHVAAGFNVMGTPHPVSPFSPPTHPYPGVALEEWRPHFTPIPCSLTPQPWVLGSLKGKVLVGVGGQ